MKEVDRGIDIQAIGGVAYDLDGHFESACLRQVAPKGL